MTERNIKLYTLLRDIVTELSIAAVMVFDTDPADFPTPEFKEELSEEVSNAHMAVEKALAIVHRYAK